MHRCLHPRRRRHLHFRTLTPHHLRYHNWNSNSNPNPKTWMMFLIPLHPPEVLQFLKNQSLFYFINLLGPFASAGAVTELLVVIIEIWGQGFVLLFLGAAMGLSQRANTFYMPLDLMVPRAWSIFSTGMLVQVRCVIVSMQITFYILLAMISTRSYCHTSAQE